MNEDIQEDTQEQVLPSDTETQEVVETTVETTPEDPLKTELEKVQRTAPKRSKVEKLKYSRQRIDEQLEELGAIDDEVVDEDNKPVTVGMLKQIQAESATKTALQLADDVSNETERALLKFHLENTIRSTGSPQQDFELARGLVNAVKNRQILEESTRKPESQTHPTGAGAPPKPLKREEELTSEELSFMKPPFNLSKEQVIAARQASEQK